MIKLLPFVLIPILILTGLGYWRYQTNKTNLATPQPSQVDQGPVEVPKTLPGASLEDRVKALEEVVTKLATQLNSLKSQTSPAPSFSDSRLSDLEASATELKARVSALEKTTTAPAVSTSKYPLYIPLGFGGGPWADQGWRTLNEYQATVNADSYQGYSGMQLEVIFRLGEVAGTGSVRLYNMTDSSVISSQIDTTSTAFSSQASATFKLPGGQKTYALQILSTQARDLYIQSARIKVNF